MSRNIRLYYLFRALSCAHVFKPFTYFYARSRGLSVFEFMALYAIFSAAVILLEVPTGAWADRLGRRRSMAVGAGLMGLASFGYLAATGFLLFAVFEFLFAAGLTLTSGADSAFLFDTLRHVGREDDYRRLEGKASYSKHMGLAVAALIGGALASIDLRLPYVVTGIVSLTAVVVAVGMREPPHTAGKQQALTWREVGDSILTAGRTIRRANGLLWAILYSAAIFVLIRMSDALYQPVLKDLGFGFFAMGAVFAGLNLVASAAAGNVCRLTRWMSDVRAMWVLPLTLVVSYLFLDAFGPVTAVVLMVAQYWVTGIYSPFTKSLINHRIDSSDVRATVLSAESAIKRTVVAVVSPLLGLIISRFSLQAGLYACAAVGVVGAAMVLAMRVSGRGSRHRVAEQGPTCSPVPASGTERGLVVGLGTGTGSGR